ncbi:hypothetical protein BDZ89DRAFT_1059289, partial [Hymenopellis radicata]
MTSPHQEGKIPWHCLTDYVSLDKYPATLSSSDFRLHKKSDPEARKKSFIHFARVLASRIAEYADGQISAVPKPDASVQEWKFAGVSEDALFPLEFLHGMKDLQNDPSFKRYACRETWEEISFESDEAAAIVVYAMTKPSKPFLYLPTLLYLAQHPRVPMSRLRSVYTSGNGDPGLDVYALEWTLNRYLFLNLVLALDSGESFDSGRDMPYRLKIQTDVQQTGACYYRDEHLHRTFWGARDTVPEQLKTPQARAAYSHRCFSVLVSWYAVMSQAVARDRAINLSTPCTTTDELTRIILYHLYTISPIFRLPGFEQQDSAYMDSLQSITCPKPLSSPSLPVKRPERATERLSRRISAFVRLPTEIHILIYSFLPSPRSLFSVTLVCKRIHDICTDLIYRDPLAINHSQGLTPDHFQFVHRRDRLVELLDERPDLANRLRSFPLAFEDHKWPQGMDIASLTPFRWSSARELTTLRLYILQTSMAPSRSIRPRILHVLLQDIARLCPNLSSLLIALKSGDNMVPSNEVSEDLSTAAYSTALKWFSLSVQGSQIQLCLSPMASSASSLSYVNLDLAEQEDIDLRSLPVCPNAKKVGLRLSTPAIEVQQLLRRSFPAVEDLHVEDCSPNQDPHPVDFSLSSPSLNHLAVLNYTIGRLPPTLQSLYVRGFYDFAQPAIPPAPSVQALCFHGIPSDEDLQALGTYFPSLRSLHIRSMYGNTFSRDHLPHLALQLAPPFPLLETLIITVKALSYRPRRMDYPMPDGLDEVQQGFAVNFFNTCRSLHVISFNGIPADDDSMTLGEFPGRVWVRFSDDNGIGARMSSNGRAMLKWKLSEYWEHDDIWEI